MDVCHILYFDGSILAVVALQVKTDLSLTVSICIYDCFNAVSSFIKQGEN